MATNYFLKLDRFEGPLDVLLHLVKLNEFDIFAINLSRLTVQYLDFLRLIRFSNLVEAGAFLEMAASLMEIKSRKLLPSEKNNLNEEEADKESSEENLQRRLLLYATFKEAAVGLNARKQTDSSSCFSNHCGAHFAKKFEELEHPIIGDSAVLLILYEQLLVNLSDKKTVLVKLSTESISVEDVMEKFLKILDQYQLVMFQSLYHGFGSRNELVASIMAFLQMARDRKIKIHQQSLHSPIWLYDMKIEDEEMFEKIPETIS